MRRFVLALGIVCCPVTLAMATDTQAASSAPQAGREGQPAPPAERASSLEELKSRLDRLEAWLGTSGYRESWNRYLLTDQLRAQMAAEQPQAAILSQIISRYRSGVAGLELAPFVGVQKALARWIAGYDFYDQQLPQIVRAAQFRPPTAEEVSRQLAELRAAEAKLKQYLAAVPTGPGWRTYLQLDRFDQELQASQPSLDALADIEQRFASGSRGLEMRPFRRVATALRRFLRGARALQEPELSQQFKGQIDSLSKALENQPAAQLVDLGPIVGPVDWLEEHDQAPEVVQAVENRFPFKNAFFTASARVIAAGYGEPLDEVQRICEVQQGTQVSGTAHTVGMVTVELIPSSRVAVWDALVRGQTISRTLGRNRSARVHLVGHTDLTGRKRMVLSADGLLAYPSSAEASTRLTTTGIGSTAGGIRGCIVTRVASRRVTQTLPEAERTTSDRAKSQLRQRLEQRAGKRLADANRVYWRNFREPLAAKDQFPTDLSFTTSSSYIFASGTFSGPVRIGAPTLPPGWTGNPDLGLVVHETAANSVAHALFAGRTLDSEEVKEKYRKNFGKLPARFEEEEEREPWSITFDDIDPIDVQFRDGGMRITIRGQRYTTGERPNHRTYRAMNVTAVYKFEQTPEGVKGIRQGDLEIFPPDFDPQKRHLSIAEQTLRRMLQRRMGNIFTPEIGGDDVVLPGQFGKAGPMRTIQMLGQGGWLAMAWQQKAQSGAVQTAMNK